jgi:metal-responsive CopG/Arc/MetJ family transcriptional regulator
MIKHFMGRKSINKEDKKVGFGITLHPELVKLLDEQSEKEGLSKSALIEDVLRNKIDNSNEK